jgi:hypothetical protein
MFGLFKRISLINREVELYKKEKFLEVDREIHEYTKKREGVVADMGRKCHEQLAAYEHDFHQAKETKGIEIAKLEAKVETLGETLKAREEVIKANAALLKSKEDEINKLNTLLLEMVKKQPNVTIQQVKA